SKAIVNEPLALALLGGRQKSRREHDPEQEERQRDFRDESLIPSTHGFSFSGNRLAAPYPRPAMLSNLCCSRVRQNAGPAVPRSGERGCQTDTLTGCVDQCRPDSFPAQEKGLSFWLWW